MKHLHLFESFSRLLEVGDPVAVAPVGGGSDQKSADLKKDSLSENSLRLSSTPMTPGLSKDAYYGFEGGFFWERSKKDLDSTMGGTGKKAPWSRVLDPKKVEILKNIFQGSFETINTDPKALKAASPSIKIDLGVPFVYSVKNLPSKVTVIYFLKDGIFYSAADVASWTTNVITKKGMASASPVTDMSKIKSLEKIFSEVKKAA